MTTERWCCDGRCNDNQGRGGCPRYPALNVSALVRCAPTCEETQRAWIVLALGLVNFIAWSRVWAALVAG